MKILTVVPSTLQSRASFASGCEGIVSKLKRSRYTSGRTHDWIKVKNPKAAWSGLATPSATYAKSGND
jgi:hypothetical protein